MPRGNVSRRRTAAELREHEARLPRELRDCGHVGVSPGDYYNSAGRPTPHGMNVCLDCYRQRERDRQASYRGGSPLATLASYSAPKVDMGGAVRRTPAKPPVQVVRNEWTGPTDLYDVYIYDEETGLIWRRKVGVTARGTKRYGDICITFGQSIRPVCKAVLFKTKALALKAEDAKIAEVDSDVNWRRVGKECWAPINLGEARV